MAAAGRVVRLPRGLAAGLAGALLALAGGSAGVVVTGWGRTR